MRATTRPVAGSTRSRPTEGGIATEIHTAPAPAARSQVLPAGRGKARTAFVAGSIRTSDPPPMYVSAHSAPSPKESSEAWTPILAMILPVTGSTRRRPAASSTHRLPAPKARPVSDAPGSARTWLARSVRGSTRSTALPVVTHAAPPPVARPRIPGSRKVAVTTARAGPRCAPPAPGGGCVPHPAAAAIRTAEVTTAQATLLLLKDRCHVPAQGRRDRVTPIRVMHVLFIGQHSEPAGSKPPRIAGLLHLWRRATTRGCRNEGLR